MQALGTSLFRPHPNRILGWWWGRKWVKSVILPLESSLYRHHPFHILGWWNKKCVPSAWRPLETSLSRTHQSRILGYSRSRKWLLSVLRPRESIFYQTETVQFSVGQVEGNNFKVTLDNLNERSSNSNKSHFGLIKKQKMKSQCLATTKKSLFYFNKVAFWAGPDAENMLRVPCEPLNHLFLDLNQVAFSDGQEDENEFKGTCEPV